MTSTRSLQDKVALVTGAASGIGRASAHRFAEAGAQLVLMDLAAEVEETADAVRQAGGAAVAVLGDAGLDEDVASAVALAVSLYGGLDVCFANAGIGGNGFGPPLELTGEQWLTLLRTNLVGPYLAIKFASQAMRLRGGGSIICTASVAGLRAGAAGPAYSASKAGVINLVQTTAFQLAGSNIRVNAICPGLVETGITREVFVRARERGTEGRLGQFAPLQRPGLPDEIAAVALFLASSESSYVNAQAVVVDGGVSGSLPFLPPRPRS
jgi:NAD(P)-dependent dehydrogenase (short-subunit alcohol dehydrogenase family)